MILIKPSALLRKIYILILAAVFLAFGTTLTFAQDASNSGEVVKKYKITFPIAELGNCSSFEECRMYCSDSANREVCVNFAKKKGFYKQSKKEKPNFQRAKEILGCDSPESCKAICQLEENREKCSEFAKVNGLKGGLRPASESGKFRGDFKGPKEGSGSGERFTPNSQQAWEHANERARFCREYPERCKSTSGEASGSGSLEERKMGKPEMEKKLMEKRELEKREMKLKEEFRQNSGAGNSNPGFGKPNTAKNATGDNVQGVSTSPSLFESLLRFFFQ